MYLKKIHLKNIKCFEDLELDFTESETVRLWTTLFGENGLGKSTLLQAMGTVLAGPSAVRELLPVAEGWVRKDEAFGEIRAEILWSSGDDTAKGPKRNKPYVIQYIVAGAEVSRLPDSLEEKPSVSEVVAWSGTGGSKEKENLTKDRKILQQTAYAEGSNGWLACGYGPFRRLSGGSESSNSIVSAERRAARFVTLFKEDAALTNAMKWLTDLHNTAREGDQKNERILQTVKRAIAENFFPEPAELIVTAKAAFLRRNGKTQILFQDLSDGYRSMLALSIDLLRWLVTAFPNEPDPLRCPGVVLIDELDTHLHPSWQRVIGHWLRAKFPKIQFIIATHSPFIAQVADPQRMDASEPNDITSPGNIKLIETENGVKAESSDESAQFLDPGQILQSDLFDMKSVLAPQVERIISQLKELRRKEKSGQASREEIETARQLEFKIEKLPFGLTEHDRAEERKIYQAVESHAALISQLK